MKTILWLLWSYLLVIPGCGFRPATPLQRAPAAEDLPALQSLISTGVSQEELNAALITAARRGSVASIRPLIAAGADSNARGGVNGWTVLMHAVHKNQDRAVIQLLAAGAKPNRIAGRGISALSMAAGYGQTAIVDLLLRSGADPRLPLAENRVALDYAVTGVADIDDWTAGKCQTPTVQRLLKAAPDVVTAELLNRTRVQQSKCSEVRELLTSAQTNLPAVLPARH